MCKDSEWAAKATFPAHDFTAGAHSVNGENVKKVMAELKKAGSETLTSDMVVHRFPVQQGMFRSLQSTVDSKAQSTMKKLNKKFHYDALLPLPTPELRTLQERWGEIIIYEGIPKNSNMTASADAFPVSPPGSHTIADSHLFFIVSCLPFNVKVRMFWNMVGKTSGAGVYCDTLYSGLGELCNKPPGQGAVVDRKVSNRAICPI
jgi:hypothetical protein